MLEDLVPLDEAELFSRALTALGRAALLLMRNARRRGPGEFEGDLLRWLETFREVYGAPNGMAALVALMRYAMLANEIREDAGGAVLVLALVQ